MWATKAENVLMNLTKDGLIDTILNSVHRLMRKQVKLI